MSYAKMTEQERALDNEERQQAKECLLAELKKLGAQIESGDPYYKINGELISICPFKKGDKWRYEIGMKKCSNVRDAAYFIMTEVLPNRKRVSEMEALLIGIRDSLPDEVAIYVRGNEVSLQNINNAEQLRQIILLMADKLRANP